MESLVSTEWLADRLGEPDLVVIDATWFMPSSGRDPRGEFLAAHIAGARFFDIDAVSDSDSPLPHMLPSAAKFGVAMSELGVGLNDRIVVYDNSPLRTSARAWFMLRHFGASSVAILDGGFEKWIAEDRPTKTGEPSPRAARFTANERDGVVTKDRLLAGIDIPWLDARGRARFEGVEPDPREGVASGHAPEARNLPYSCLYDNDGCMKSPDELRELFAKAGIDPRKPFVASCGSGVTANSIIFAAHLLGNDDALLYDGSWSEWGADPATPKVLGPARRG
ncbi:MAG TPA: sulfurtransferase [Sphingomicrobium sp.]|nr:sulfurtransferase [Sphingomicrobium sp.]